MIDIKRYTKYPVLIPRIEARGRPRDLQPLLRGMYIIGLVMILSASLFLFVLNLDEEIRGYIALLSLVASLPLPAYVISRHFYEGDWVRLRIESEMPYFASTVDFLVRSGRSLLESIKLIVSKRIFPYTSISLSGVEGLSDVNMLHELSSKSRSPLLKRFTREVSTDFNRIDVLLDDTISWLNILSIT
jgi:hypothetical protein